MIRRFIKLKITSCVTALWLTAILINSSWATENATLLHHAWIGCVPCIDEDINAGMNIDFQNQEGSTALIVALDRKHPAAARLLIERGGDVNLGRFDGFVPAHYATRYLDLLQLIYSRGGDIFARAHRGDTPLLSAIQYGNLRSITWLLNKGASPTARNSNGQTGLHMAVAVGASSRIIEVLSQAENTPADWIDTPDQLGETALMLAVRMGRIEIANTLLSMGANKQATNHAGRGLYHLAVESGLTQAWVWVNSLKNMPQTSQARDKRGVSPIELAASIGSMDILALLLTASTLELRDPEGNTLLHHAVRGSRIENIRLILDRNSSLINTQNAQGETAAFLASASGRMDILELLYARGADFSIADGKGVTPLGVAAKNKLMQITLWLSTRP